MELIQTVPLPPAPQYADAEEWPIAPQYDDDSLSYVVMDTDVMVPRSFVDPEERGIAPRYDDDALSYVILDTQVMQPQPLFADVEERGFSAPNYDDDSFTYVVLDTGVMVPQSFADTEDVLRLSYGDEDGSVAYPQQVIPLVGTFTDEEQWPSRGYEEEPSYAIAPPAPYQPVNWLDTEEFKLLPTTGVDEDPQPPLTVLPPVYGMYWTDEEVFTTFVPPQPRPATNLTDVYRGTVTVSGSVQRTQTLGGSTGGST